MVMAVKKADEVHAQLDALDLDTLATEYQVADDDRRRALLVIVVAKLSPMIGAAARRYAWSVYTADDLEQEAVFALFEVLDRWSPSEGPFLPYARLIVNYRLGKIVTRERRRTRVEWSSALEESDLSPRELTSTSPTPPQVAIANETLDRLRGSCTAIECTALDLKLAGYAPRESAAVLNCTPHRVSQALDRVRQRLRHGGMLLKGMVRQLRRRGAGQ